MSDEDALLAAIRADPADRVAWLALADWLEENDLPAHGELLRLQLWLTGHLDDAQRPAAEARQRQLLRDGLVPRVPQRRVVLKDEVRLTLSLIPAGEFTMGRSEKASARGEEGPRHRVTLSRPYYIATTPVTQRQWAALMGSRPANHKGAGHPVERVNWDDCVGFCARLTERSGLTVRLPSEAEWEYACRAGSSADFYSGDADEDLARVAWFDGQHTHAVAGKQPNGWGLYDTLGNVWEWTRDAYRDYPPRGRARRDPVRDRASSYRSARGGSYSNPAGCCRSSGRICFAAGGRNDFIGFRPVVEWRG
ncbi:MAG: SUMF1/EgtB/PvdO family nonheme iron enzyme [Gemmataceae bacterium]